MQLGKKSLMLNAVLNTTKTVLGIVFPLIVYPYLSRVLRAEALGAYNFSISIMSYFLLLAGLGVSTYAIREGAQLRGNQDLIDEFVSQIYSISIVASILSYVLLYFAILYIPKIHNNATMLAVLSIEIAFTTFGVSWIYNIYEDFLFIAIRTLFFQFISLIATVLLVRSTSDVFKYVYIVSVTNAVSNLINHYVAKKKYCNFHFTLNMSLSKHLKPILVIFSTSIAISLYVNSDITMLGFMKGNYQVGLYSTAVKIYTVLKNVLAAMLAVLIPKFSIILNSKDNRYANIFFSHILCVLTTVVLPLSIGLFMLSKETILIVAGEEFVQGAFALRLLSVAIIFSLYAYMLTQCILIPLRKEKIVFTATLASAITNIVLNLRLIPKWGFNAAALTTLIAELITLLIVMYACRGTVQLINVSKTIISSIIGCISIVIVCTVASYCIKGLLAYVIISIIGSGAVYMITLVLLGNEIALSLVSNIRMKLDKS